VARKRRVDSRLVSRDLNNVKGAPHGRAFRQFSD
jgi:hypothetical protein